MGNKSKKQKQSTCSTKGNKESEKKVQNKEKLPRQYKNIFLLSPMQNVQNALNQQKKQNLQKNQNQFKQIKKTMNINQNQTQKSLLKKSVCCQIPLSYFVKTANQRIKEKHQNSSQYKKIFYNDQNKYSSKLFKIKLLKQLKQNLLDDQLSNFKFVQRILKKNFENNGRNIPFQQFTFKDKVQYFPRQQSDRKYKKLRMRKHYLAQDEFQKIRNSSNIIHLNMKISILNDLLLKILKWFQTQDIKPKQDHQINLLDSFLQEIKEKEAEHKDINLEYQDELFLNGITEQVFQRWNQIIQRSNKDRKKQKIYLKQLFIQIIQWVFIMNYVIGVYQLTTEEDFNLQYMFNIFVQPENNRNFNNYSSIDIKLKLFWKTFSQPVIMEKTINYYGISTLSQPI